MKRSVHHLRFWTGWHQFYRAEAADRLISLDHAKFEFDSEAAPVLQELGRVGEMVVALSSRRQSISLDAMIVHLLACMAVEGFLNHYGVAALGEEYFAENCERLSARRKTSLLLLGTTGTRLSSDHELLGIVGRLFRVRNGFVHPKAVRREVDSGLITSDFSAWQGNVAPQSAKRSVADMNRFFELFAELDPAAKPFVAAV